MASAAPTPAKGLGSSGYRTALRPWAATWKSHVPRGAERQCTSASHSPARDADCKKTDAQVGHQGPVAGYRASLHTARRHRGNLIPLGALAFQVAAVASGAT